MIELETNRRIVIVDFDRTGVGASISPILSEIFGLDCEHIDLPFPKTELREEQCDARDIVKYLREQLPQRGDLVLGITRRDSFVPSLNFVFGLADMKSGAAMVSFYRLKNSRQEIFLERCLKEAVHEIGHLFELGHCMNPICVMHFSNSLIETDLKSYKLCERCSERISKQGTGKRKGQTQKVAKRYE